MIESSSKSILFIEPTFPANRGPVIDEYTRKMTAAYHQTLPGFLHDGEIVDIVTMGFQRCSCGASSDNVNHVLPDKSAETNSLCVHYLAHHRDEVPESELQKVASLTYGEEDPTTEELSRIASNAEMQFKD